MKYSTCTVTTQQHEKFLAESRQISSLLEMRRDMDMLIESACNTMPLAEQKQAKRLYLEWKNIGYMLNEAQLKPEQINQVFRSAEEQMSATGANRTVVGKVADVGGSIASGLARVRDAISSTGPVSGFDVGFDTIQGKLLSAAGGEAGAVGKALQKYKEIGAKYPVTQKVIYTGLIMLSGLSAAGAGGIAIVAGIKTLDGLLKGKKFSTAVMDSLPGAALSWIMQHLPSNTVPEVRAAEPPAGVTPASVTPEYSDSPETPPFTPPSEVPAEPEVGSTTGGGEIAPEPDLTDYVVKPGDTLSGIAQKNSMSVDDIMKVNPQITNPNDLADGEHINLPAATGAKTYAGGVGTASDTAGKVARGAYTPSRYGIKEAAYTLTVLPYAKLVDVNRTAQAIKENASWEYHPTYVHLSHAGVRNVFENTAGLHTYLIEAGFWKNVGSAIGKGAKAVAGGLEKAGQFAGKVGRNVTNKVTADKLMMNWKVAGKPTDSSLLLKFLLNQGVSRQVISAVYKKMGIPVTNVTPEPFDISKYPLPGSLKTHMGNPALLKSIDALLTKSAATPSATASSTNRAAMPQVTEAGFLSGLGSVVRSALRGHTPDPLYNTPQGREKVYAQTLVHKLNTQLTADKVNSTNITWQYMIDFLSKTVPATPSIVQDIAQDLDRKVNKSAGALTDFNSVINATNRNATKTIINQMILQTVSQTLQGRVAKTPPQYPIPDSLLSVAASDQGRKQIIAAIDKILIT